MLRLRTPGALPEGTVLSQGTVLSEGTGLPEGTTAALRDLAAGDVGELELTAGVLGTDGPDGVLRLQLLLRRLDAAGQLERGVRAGGRTLARLRPVGRGRVPWTTRLPPSRPVKLSRFAVVRVADGHLIAQAPRSHTVVELSPEAGCLLGALARWTTPAELSTAEASTAEARAAEASTVEASTGVRLPAGTVAAILPLLADAGLLAPGGPEADTETTRARPGPVDRARPVAAQPQPGAAPNAAYGGAYPMADRVPAAAGPARNRHWPDTGRTTLGPDNTGPDAGPRIQLAVPGAVRTCR